MIKYSMQGFSSLCVIPDNDYSYEANKIFQKLLRQFFYRFNPSKAGIFESSFFWEGGVNLIPPLFIFQEELI